MAVAPRADHSSVFHVVVRGCPSSSKLSVVMRSPPVNLQYMRLAASGAAYPDSLTAGCVYWRASPVSDW